MKVIILCAGLGSRLNSKQPKGFIKIKGQTLLDRIIKNFLYYKINKKDIFFATGFKEAIESPDQLLEALHAGEFTAVQQDSANKFSCFNPPYDESNY